MNTGMGTRASKRARQWNDIEPGRKAREGGPQDHAADKRRRLGLKGFWDESLRTSTWADIKRMAEEAGIMDDDKVFMIDIGPGATRLHLARDDNGQVELSDENGLLGGNDGGDF